MVMVPKEELPPVEVLDKAVMNVLKRHAHYDPHQDGYWMVHGEDQSGSYHSSYAPLLGIIKGEFHRAVALAVRAKGFYYWTSIGGSNGGSIVPIQIDTV